MDDLHDKVFMLLQLRKQQQTLPTPLLVGITTCLSIVSLLGIIGNILVIVFFFKSLKDVPQNVYVIALASLDLAVCAIVIPSTIYQDVWQEPSSDLSCKVFNVLRYSLVPSSAFLLCLIAVDRFVIICFVPGIHTTRKNSLLYIAIALTLGAIVGTPGGLTTGARVRIKVDNRSDQLSSDLNVLRCTSDYSIISESFLKAYRPILTVLFSAMLLLLVFFYVNIFCFVRRRQQRWANSRSYVASKLVIKATNGGGESGSQREGKKQRHFSSRNDEVTEVSSWAPAEIRPPSLLQEEEQQICIETNMDEAMAQPDIHSNHLLPPKPNDCPGRSVEFVGEENVGEASDIEEPPAPPKKYERGDSVASEHLAQARQDLAERTRKRPHIKTARVLSVITFFYVLSYLPFFMVYHWSQPGRLEEPTIQSWQPDEQPKNQTGLIWNNQQPDLWLSSENVSAESNRLFDSRQVTSGSSAHQVAVKMVFYFYFINHGANPVIYGCMNTYFKQQVYSLFGNMRCRRR